nr:hypothetical protein [Acutalibacter muris]
MLFVMGAGTTHYKDFLAVNDYVLTHCAPRSIQTMIASWYENDSLTSFLERVRIDLQFKRWYFGHYHIDKQLNEQFVALYNKVVPM